MVINMGLRLAVAGRVWYHLLCLCHSPWIANAVVGMPNMNEMFPTTNDSLVMALKECLGIMHRPFLCHYYFLVRNHRFYYHQQWLWSYWYIYLVTLWMVVLVLAYGNHGCKLTDSTVQSHWMRGLDCTKDVNHVQCRVQKIEVETLPKNVEQNEANMTYRSMGTTMGADRGFSKSMTKLWLILDNH